jgi:hypothetical protein
MPGMEPQFLDYPAYGLVTVGYLNATQLVWKSDIDQEPFNSCASFKDSLERQRQGTKTLWFRVANTS